MKKGIILGLLFGLLGLWKQPTFCMKKNQVQHTQIKSFSPDITGHDIFWVVLEFVPLNGLLNLSLGSKNLYEQIWFYLTHPNISKRIIYIPAQILKRAIDSKIAQPKESKNGPICYDKLCTLLNKNKRNLSLDLSGKYIFDYSNRMNLPHEPSRQINISQVITGILVCCKDQLVELSLMRFISTEKKKAPIFSNLINLKQLTLKEYKNHEQDNPEEDSYASFRESPIILEELLLISNLTNLTQLILDGIEYNKKQEFTYLSSLKNLRILYIKISSCNSPISLDSLKKLTQLQKLTLAKNETKSQNPACVLFNFSSGNHISITDNELVHLPHSLQVLVITIPGITDEGVQHYIVHLKNLMSLTLTGKNITNKSLDILVNHPRLNQVTLNGCGVTREKVDAFSEKVTCQKVTCQVVLYTEEEDDINSCIIC